MTISIYGLVLAMLGAVIVVWLFITKRQHTHEQVERQTHAKQRAQKFAELWKETNTKYNDSQNYTVEEIYETNHAK